MTVSRVLCSLAAVTVLACIACRHDDGGATQKAAALPPGVAAIVGADRIDLDTVSRIARASAISLTEARDRAIFDALLAAGAKARFGPSVAHHAEAAASARALLERFKSAAESAGPPSDAEVAEVTEGRWWELDRPPLRRTTHAVVVVDKPEQEKAARALADRVASAVAGATDAASFRALASGVSSPGLTVKVEDLEPVAEDGRAVNPSAPPPAGSQTVRYSLAYAAAAFAVPGLLGVSPVVRSEFGFHVILVTELVPELRVPLEERRRSLAPEVLTRRAAKLEKDALERARITDRVDVERSAAELTEKVDVAR